MRNDLFKLKFISLQCLCLSECLFNSLNVERSFLIILKFNAVFSFRYVQLTLDLVKYNSEQDVFSFVKL